MLRKYRVLILSTSLTIGFGIAAYFYPFLGAIGGVTAVAAITEAIKHKRQHRHATTQKEVSEVVTTLNEILSPEVISPDTLSPDPMSPEVLSPENDMEAYKKHCDDMDAYRRHCEKYNETSYHITPHGTMLKTETSVEPDSGSGNAPRKV